MTNTDDGVIRDYTVHVRVTFEAEVQVDGVSHEEAEGFAEGLPLEDLLDNYIDGTDVVEVIDSEELA